MKIEPRHVADAYAAITLGDPDRPPSLGAQLGALETASLRLLETGEWAPFVATLAVIRMEAAPVLADRPEWVAAVAALTGEPMCLPDPPGCSGVSMRGFRSAVAP